MKKIFKIVMSIVGICYLGVIIFVTGCLLFYNQYKVTQINDKTFIIIDDKSDMYNDGDLVIFTKNPNDEIVSGDEIFFYEVTNGTVNVVSGKVTNSEKITDTETTFTINGNHKISSESVIGKTLTASTYPNVGKMLYVFESRFGFLLLVILPALIFFFYEIYRLIQDIKASKEVTSVDGETVLNNNLVSQGTETVASNNGVQTVEPVSVNNDLVSPSTEPATSNNGVQTVEPVSANNNLVSPSTEPATSNNGIQTVEPVSVNNDLVSPSTEPVVLQNEEPITAELPTVDNDLLAKQVNSSLSEQSNNSELSSLSNQDESLVVNNNVNTETTESLSLDDKKDL